MSVLGRRIWRAYRKSRLQFLAVALVVMIGVSTYISMNTAYYNLEHSRDVFYREHDFADYYFHVVRAPYQVIKRVQALPGVDMVTGRVQMDLPIIRENGERGTARLTGYHLPMDKEVNRIQLLSGRMFDEDPSGGRIEVLTDPQFAAANRLNPGDSLVVAAQGREVTLAVTGTAGGPEFIYPMKDAASLMPEPENFGIVMAPLNQVQQVLGYSGQINQVLIRVTPGYDPEEVAERVEKILEPYGNLAGYPRKDQLSHAMLNAELEGLQKSASSLPAVFLVLAAIIQYVMLGRMIKTQRREIGILKALGFDRRSIVLHYAAYAMVITVVGAILGIILGIALSSVISKTYAMFFNLPQEIGGINVKAIFFGLLSSLAAGAAAGLGASRGILALNPAESMRSEPPRVSGRIWLERWSRLWKRLDNYWRMSFRTVWRNGWRSFFAMIGVMFAAGMLIIAFFADDSMDHMLNRHFTLEKSYDYLVRFTEPVKEYEILNISRLDGVIKAEPLLEVPVRVSFGGRKEDDVLLGMNPGTTLKTVFNVDGELLAIPEDGVLLGEITAGKLGVKVGDQVTIETRMQSGVSQEASLKVLGINRQMIGSESFVSLKQANKVLRESRIVTAVMLKVDPGKAAGIEKELNRMTGVSSIQSRQRELAGFEKQMGYMIYFVVIMVSFAAILGFAIVYNSSIIGFGERQRELALLKMMGFSDREMGGLLLRETLLQSIPGVLLGLPFGRMMSQWYVAAISTEAFTFPVVVYPRTYIISAIIGVLFVLAAHWFASRGIRHIEPSELLKNND
ncbi:MAG: ABC transporter permease [Syntrophomonadaceae bacterium]|nr:ABC transporter permease [Syntrophomonadaceae bacterium]